LNTYAYVVSNPLRWIDLLGLYRTDDGIHLMDGGTISLEDIVDCIKSKGKDPVSCGKFLGPGNLGCNQLFENCFGQGPTYRERINYTCDVMDSSLDQSKIPGFPTSFTQKSSIKQAPLPQYKYPLSDENYNGSNPFDKPVLKPPFQYPPPIGNGRNPFNKPNPQKPYRYPQH